MTKNLIQPRVLKGFRDTLPKAAIPRTRMISTMQEVFSTFGFVPIDTPALEYAEILLGKGSDETDKQMYRFEDNGGRDVALRFDLTVPLARFAAQHISEVGIPFKRYHIAPVWRAEKPQRGRFREFIQCDVDIIGSTSIVADAEIVAVIDATLSKLKIKHDIRLNNRRLLNGLLAKLGAADKSSAILRAIDKLAKLGKDTVCEELEREAGVEKTRIEEIFGFLQVSADASNPTECVGRLKEILAGSKVGEQGIAELEGIFEMLSKSSIDDSAAIDLSIARGLDYYTGTIFETTFSNLPEIGSICSGGRYDNLASLYTKQQLPGVGTSFGLDRILAGLEELELIEEKSSTANALVTYLDEESSSSGFQLANSLRNAGISTEQSLSAGKLGNQLKYANKKGIPIVVIFGSTEMKEGCCSIKDLRSGEQKDNVVLASAAEEVKNLLNRG